MAGCGQSSRPSVRRGATRVFGAYRRLNRPLRCPRSWGPPSVRCRCAPPPAVTPRQPPIANDTRAAAANSIRGTDTMTATSPPSPPFPAAATFPRPTPVESAPPAISWPSTAVRDRGPDVAPPLSSHRPPSRRPRYPALVVCALRSSKVSTPPCYCYIPPHSHPIPTARIAASPIATS